jgi:hypothetical protein
LRKSVNVFSVALVIIACGIFAISIKAVGERNGREKERERERERKLIIIFHRSRNIYCIYYISELCFSFVFHVSRLFSM